MIAYKWPALTGLLVLLSIPACRLAPVEPAGPEVIQMIKIGDEMGYYEYLMEKPKASTADGARITSLLLGAYPWNKSLDEIKAHLLKKGW